MTSTNLRHVNAGWRAAPLLLMALCVWLCVTMYAPAVQARRLDSRGRLKGRLTYISTFAGVVANTDRPLQRDITDIASTAYTVPKNTAMYHCTSVKFQKLREGPTWFSLDVSEGFKMAVKQGVLKSRDTLCHKVQPTKDLKLFLMKRKEALSRIDLNTNAQGGVRVWPRAIPPWYGKPYNSNVAVQGFVDDFCTVMGAEGYDGWRNPWDQDEIMLCPITNNVGTSIASKISYVGVILCPKDKTKSVLATNADDLDGNPANPRWPDTFKYWSDVFSDPVGGHTERLHYLMLSTVPHAQNGYVTKNIPATIDAGAAIDVSGQFYKAACATVAPNDWQLFFTVKEKRQFLLDNPEPVAPLPKKRNDPPGELTKEQKQVKNARLKVEKELNILLNSKAYTQEVSKWTTN